MTCERQSSLFDEDSGLAPVPTLPPVLTVSAGVARVLMPNRMQLELRACDLESLLPEGRGSSGRT